jgi:3-dehydroquinate dehydratase-2
MTQSRSRVELMHGVNLDMLGRRDPAHYGTLTLAELERQVRGFAQALGLELACFQTNSEAEFVEHLHGLSGSADGLLLNPGAWTHYAWSIHDALEIAALPAVEVHLSAIDAREEWRRVSVIRDLCLATVSGQGLEGYREALVRLSKELDG